jgi:hypothetical protein
VPAGTRDRVSRIRHIEGSKKRIAESVGQVDQSVLGTAIAKSGGS